MTEQKKPPIFSKSKKIKQHEKKEKNKKNKKTKKLQTISNCSKQALKVKLKCSKKQTAALGPRPACSRRRALGLYAAGGGP